MTSEHYDDDPGGRPATAPTLVVAARRDDRAVVVTLRGELDLDGRDSLHAVVGPELGGATSSIAFDLTELTFVDSAGLQALLDISEAAEDRGIGFAVLGVSPAVDRIVRIAGLADLLPDAG